MKSSSEKEWGRLDVEDEGEKEVNNEEGEGGEVEPDVGRPAYPGAAMRVGVYAVKHSEALWSVVKFIRFVLASIAALNSVMLPSPLNYVQPELHMNMK